MPACLPSMYIYIIVYIYIIIYIYKWDVQDWPWPCEPIHRKNQLTIKFTTLLLSPLRSLGWGCLDDSEVDDATETSDRNHSLSNFMGEDSRWCKHANCAAKNSPRSGLAYLRKVNERRTHSLSEYAPPTFSKQLLLL